MTTDIHFVSCEYLAQFFLEWETFQTKVIEKIKTHILCSITFFRKSCRLWDNVEKYCRPGQATDDNMAHAHCIWIRKARKHTLRICNTCCLPSAAMVARTPLIVTLYVHGLSCYNPDVVSLLRGTNSVLNTIQVNCNIWHPTRYFSNPESVCSF